MKHVKLLTILLAMLVACVAPAMAQDTGTTDATAAVKNSKTDTVTVTETEAVTEMDDGTVIVEGTQTVEVDEEPSFLTMEFGYTYASRFIWRGRELFPDNDSCNNQYTLAGSMDIAQLLGADAGTLGRLNGAIFAQTADGSDTRYIQRVDYTVSYSYDFDEIGLSTEVGFIYYAFPGTSGSNTQELFFKLGMNDGLIMQAIGIGDGTPILNPTLAMYFDIDEAAGGWWTELGMSHDFVLSELGCEDITVLQDLTLGLNMTLGWACGYPESNSGNNTAYYGNDTNSGMTNNFGMTADLDLQSMLDLPDCMDMNLGAFLNYTCSMDTNAPYVDVLWGGVSLTVGF